jgi:alkylation response protein AidB-like acyl-CoA dehydrogenase
VTNKQGKIMSFEMKPLTPAGTAVIDAAEALIPGFRDRSPTADRNAEMCRENFTDLQRTRIAAAFVPEELGGYGLTSIHDWLLLIATLGRGDGSTAIAINMHLGVSRGMAMGFEAAKRGGRSTERAELPLKAIVAGEMLVCATATERGTDNLHPQTLATETEDGWQINGHKMFLTMSPIATHLAMNLKMQNEDGDHLGTTMLPIGTKGILPQGDWDSLGMRGSGSQSVSFENVQVGKSAVRRLGPWGKWSTNVLINRTLGNLPLVAAFLGIAEHAFEITMKSLMTQKRLGEPVNRSSGVQQMVGEMEIELASCRSILQRAGTDVDEWLERASQTPPTIEQAHHLMKGYQTAKWVINRGAINIVDRAMDLVGGAGFMSSHPLSQLYRDVRAGPFMQPHAPTDIRGYLGQVALDQFPED